MAESPGSDGDAEMYKDSYFQPVNWSLMKMYS